jgi:hypothetical protein
MRKLNTNAQCQNGKTQLSPRDRVIAREYAMGRSQAGIARHIGLSRGAVTSALARPEVQGHVAALLDAADRAAIAATVYAPWVRAILPADNKAGPADLAPSARRRRRTGQRWTNRHKPTNEPAATPDADAEPGPPGPPSTPSASGPPGAPPDTDTT